MPNVYINVNEISEHQKKEELRLQEERDRALRKKQRDILLKPITATYSFAKKKIGQAIQSQRSQKELREDIKNKIRQGRINDLKDIEKQFGYGSAGHSYASQLIRQKQMQQAREKAIFESKKKMMIRAIKSPPKRPANFVNPMSGMGNLMFGEMGIARPKPVKGKKLVKKVTRPMQSDSYKKTMEQIWRL